MGRGKGGEGRGRGERRRKEGAGGKERGRGEEAGAEVERGGANVAEAFMVAGEGWLRPGTVVGYDVGRGFSQPGQYVIRVSGCLTTDLKSSACTWNAIAGDVVTFRIQ